MKPELYGALVHLRYVSKWQVRYAEIYNQHYKILRGCVAPQRAISE